MGRSLRSPCAIAALVLSGCPAPSLRGEPERRDTGADTARSDLDASVEVDSAVRALETPEICTNGVDEDRNGSIDDGCACGVGTRRACWPGPPDMRTIGACSDGEQTCDSDGVNAAWSTCRDARMPTREVRGDATDNDCDGATDEPDAVCEPTEQRETVCDDGLDTDCDTATDCADPDCRSAPLCERSCPPSEAVCWGGVDDDCDARIDCEDTDCAMDPSCRSEMDCPPGQVQTYRQRMLGASRGPSSIERGDGAPQTSAQCEDGSCPPGQVRVVAGGRSLCVPPPSECPEGQSASYSGYAHWTCEPPCELIIHYGHIYGGQNVCAGWPDVRCPDGQAPTFVFETQEWSCRPTCDNGLYDRIDLGGLLVCIPC